MTNTYDTSNEPLGSTAVKVLYNNASNLDEAVNSDADTWIDRPPFGRIRRTWRGMENAFDQFLLNSGYQFIGDYDADGPLTITAANQIFSKDGEFWRAGPDLALPYTTVNNWVVDQPKFVSTGDATLRSDLSSDAGASLVRESRWGLTLQDVVNMQPHYLSAYGFPHGGDDLAALQSLLNQISTDGGGRIIYDMDDDVPVSNGVFVPSNISLEFTGKGFLKLTAMTTQGALLTVFTGDRSDPPVSNVRLINPRLDCGGFGWPTSDPYGNNGIAGTNCYDVEVWGGIVKNAKHGATSLYSTGGTGCNFETGCRNILVDGLAIQNCSAALGTAAAFNTTPPLDFRTSTGIQFRNIRAFDCGVIFQGHQATNPPSETVDIIAGSIRGVDAYNCGRGQQPGTETDYGALIFDRASNWDIGDINIFNTTAYGSVPAIIRFIRSTKMKFSNINLFGNCDVMVSHVRPNVVPQFNYSGSLRDNVFEVTCHGSVIDAIKAVAVDVAGTWRECKYHLRMYSLSGLLVNMDSSAPGATNIALFELGVDGKTVSGNLPQIRTLSNTFPSGQFTRIGPQRFNTLTLNSATGSDSLVADGSLNLAAAGVVKLSITSGGFITADLPTYATNAAAVTGGVPANGLYKTSTGELRIRV